MALIHPDVWCRINTDDGVFRLYQNEGHREDYCLVSFGPLDELPSSPLVRIHSSCLASETFGSVDCDCADQLRYALQRIKAEGSGLVIYLRQEGRGQGLAWKIKAMQLGDTDGYDTFEAYCALGLEQDTRDYALAADILREIEIGSVRLLTNNALKVDGLVSHGVLVTEVVSHVAPIRPETRSYLQVKRDRLGHTIDLAHVLLPQSEKHK